MQESFELEAEVRTDMGKGASRRLRHASKVPAIIYGGGKDPQALTIAHNELFHHLQHEAFYSHILSIKVDGKKQKAILRDVQRHPSAPIIMHIDFLRVNEKESLKMSVPLHFINEENCVGVKTGGGVISHSMTQVEIQCLAKDIPEFIEVDLEEVNLGEIVHLSDLKLPKGIELMEIIQGHDLAVVNVMKAKMVKEEDDEAPVAADTKDENADGEEKADGKDGK